MGITKLCRISSACVLAASIVGCAAPTSYYWGHYEPVVYQHYNQEISPDEQIATLEKDLATAQTKNKAVPPGAHAHIGMLYMQKGQQSAALTHFAKEKSLFPESSHYIDFLINYKKPKNLRAESDSSIKPTATKLVK
ncbi:DUF4810 domain-containing protein [Streptomyces albidoflavus]